MRILLILTALMFTGSGIAQSQGPPPAPFKDSEQQQSHPSTTDEKAANNPAGTDKQPFVVKSLEAEKTSERTEQERPEREEKSANERSLIAWTIVLAIASIVLALIAGGQIFLFLWQLRLIGKSIIDTKNSADAALEMAKSIRISERAYVKMSHQPPGLVFDPLGGMFVQIQVKNFGRTPARINDVAIEFMSIADTESIPVNPPVIKKRQSFLGFLVTNDDFFCTYPSVPGDTFTNEVKTGADRLLVGGHIDYTDAFEHRYRAGYERIYNFTKDRREHYPTDELFNQRSNLDLVINRAYNYDRPYKDSDDHPW